MKRLLVLSFLIFLIGMIGRTNNVQGGIGGWQSHRLADFDEDCIISVVDAQMISFRYGAYFPRPLYEKRFDLEPYMVTGQYDWDIDIKDIQKVTGRMGMTCIRFWDPQTAMGMYSYKAETPTGPGTSCDPKAKNPPGLEYYVDPIGVVFFSEATISLLKEEARNHGFSSSDNDPEQRFWEIGNCSFEDVDAWQDRFWTCGSSDSCEAWHFRAEVADLHETWGIYAVATPHFDDDCWPWGHFVPEIFPYPEELYLSFSGSGFEAGTYWVFKKFFLDGDHGFGGVEYWGNTQPIQQGACADNQWPQGDGFVYYVQIP